MSSETLAARRCEDLAVIEQIVLTASKDQPGMLVDEEGRCWEMWQVATGVWMVHRPDGTESAVGLYSGDLDKRGYFDGNGVCQVVDSVRTWDQGKVVILTPSALVAYGEIVAPGSYEVGSDEHLRWWVLERQLWRRMILIREREPDRVNRTTLWGIDYELAEERGWGPIEVALATKLYTRKMRGEEIEMAVEAVRR